MQTFNTLLDILIPESDNQPSGRSVFERRQIISECEVELAGIIQWVEHVLSGQNIEAEAIDNVTKSLRADNLQKWRHLVALIAEVYCGDERVFELLYGTSKPLSDHFLVNIDFDIDELVKPVLANKSKYRCRIG